MDSFSKCILNKLITVDDKDPRWLNESIKKKIMVKKYPCKAFNANNKSYGCLPETPDHINRIVRNNIEEKRGLLLSTLR